MPTWLAWAPLGAAVLHIVEEFVFPGGFAEWDRRYRPAFRKSITSRLHIVVNALLLVACYDAAALAARPIGPAYWLGVTSLLAGNGIWHVRAAVRTKGYSPGMVTGAVLYVPLALYGLVHFLGAGMISWLSALVAIAIGAAYPLAVGTAMHRWRTSRAAAARDTRPT